MRTKKPILKYSSFMGLVQIKGDFFYGMCQQLYLRGIGKSFQRHNVDTLKIDAVYILVFILPTYYLDDAVVFKKTVHLADFVIGITASGNVDQHPVHRNFVRLG